jgi:hypothetical protein
MDRSRGKKRMESNKRWRGGKGKSVDGPGGATREENTVGAEAQ